MITYEVTLTDTRRVDLVTQFLTAAGIPSTAILGTIGALSSTVEPNNPTFKVIAVDATVGAVMLAYDSGPLPSSVASGGLTVGSDGKAVIARDDLFWSIVNGACIRVANTGQGFDIQGGIHYRAAFGLNIPTTFLLDGISADILDSGGNYQATYTPIGMQVPLSLSGSDPASHVVSLLPFQQSAATFNGITIPQGAIILPWATSQPSVGATFKLRVYSVNQAKIFSTSGHPIDLLTQWWTNVGITYDAGAAAAVRHQLGDFLAVVYRFDESSNQGRTLYDVVQAVITAPFGITWRVDDQQRRVLFVCRDLSLLTLPSGSWGPVGPLTPIETLGLNDLRNAEASAFDLDERSIKNRVVVSWQQIRPWDAKLDGGDRPPDGNVAVTQPPIQLDYSTNGGISIGGTPEPDSDIAGVKEWRIDLPGFVGQTVVNAPIPGTVQAFDMTQWAIQVAIGVFNRVGRGAPLVTLPVIRGHSVADVGDIIATTADHVVNTFLDLFPVSQRIREGGGSRLLQVVQKTPNPDGPDLLCWDIGPGTSVETVPEFTLAVDATDPYHVAVATLTNAPALVALGTGTQVLVQFGVGATEPTTGQPGGVIDPASATLDLALPPVNGGSTVWVRMLGSVPGLGPGTWSAWQSVDLTALPPPTGLSATPTANGTDLLLTWTPGSTLFPEAVYQDGVLLAILPPGTDHYLVQGVSGSHTFTVRTIDPSPLAGQSTAASVTQAPTGGVTLSTPIDPAAFAGSHDASGVLVIDGTYGLEVTATAIPSTVVFEVATETAVGSGTYGSYVVMAQLAAVQGGRTRFTTKASINDGLRRQIRAKSTRNGATDSSYTSAQVVDPWSQQTLPPAPPRLTAVWGAGTLAVFLQGDPQTVSFKIAASTSAYPSDATVRAATALNATRNQATTGALVSGLVVNDLIYVSAFAYTELDGAGTESAQPAKATFVYGGGAAPVDASYLTAVAESLLPNSRQLVAIEPITLTDNGPGTQEAIGIDLSDTGVGGGFVGAVCVGEFALFGWTDYVRLNNYPGSLTDLNTIGIPHWKRDQADAAQLYARIQAYVVTACTGHLAVQYFNGSSWRYLDGVSGPFVSLGSTGLQVGGLVPVEAGALADVEMRLVASGGNDASACVLSMVRMDFCQLASALPPPAGAGEAGGGGGDCSTVSSDGMEYADIAAATAAGWAFTNTSTTAQWAMAASPTHGGSKSLAVQITSGSSINGVLEATRTFGTGDGLSPNTHYTVKVWGYMGFRPWYDSESKLFVNGSSDAITGFISNQGVWIQLVCRGISDSAGNLVVKLRRPGTLQSGYTGVNWDDLTIQVGDTC